MGSNLHEYSQIKKTKTVVFIREDLIVKAKARVKILLLLVLISLPFKKNKHKNKKNLANIEYYNYKQKAYNANKCPKKEPKN